MCRHYIADIVKIFVPGGTRDAELDKAIARCKKAENRVVELEARLGKRERKKAEQHDAAFWDSLSRRLDADADGKPVHDKMVTKATKIKKAKKEKRSKAAKDNTGPRAINQMG